MGSGLGEEVFSSRNCGIWGSESRSWSAVSQVRACDSGIVRFAIRASSSGTKLLAGATSSQEGGVMKGTCLPSPPELLHTNLLNY